MSKQSNQTKATGAGRPTFVSHLRQIEVVEKAVAAVLENFSKVEIAKDEVGKIEGGQLAVLANALKNIPAPITEEVWDKMFKANVSELLAGATVNGRARYANAASRDVMVNLFKVATIGLTLAKQKPEYDPAVTSATNLKKYVTLIRPKLQADIDPASGKPRLRAGAPKAPKMLSGDMRYWLVGCEDAEVGLGGMVGVNRIIFGEHDFKKLEEGAKVMERTYQSFGYIVGELKPMPVEEYEIVVKMNTAILALDEA